jgi:hypothetical protein
MNIQTNINTPIELVDNTQKQISNKSSILTSASLENLNEQAEST